MGPGVGLGFHEEARLSGQWVWAHPLWRAASSLCIWSGYPGKGEEAAGAGHQEAFLPPGELRKGEAPGSCLQGRHGAGGAWSCSVRLSGGMGAPWGLREPAPCCPVTSHPLVVVPILQQAGDSGTFFLPVWRMEKLRLHE